MTNELGTTLQDIEAKAERKKEIKRSLFVLRAGSNLQEKTAQYHYDKIRKYIEEN